MQSAPSKRNRTCDQPLRRRLLYPLSYGASRLRVYAGARSRAHSRAAPPRRQGRGNLGICPMAECRVPWWYAPGPRGSPTPAESCRAPGMPDQKIYPGQLALELPSALPAIAIEPDWKLQPRLWGHSLHPMCSYLASFPAALAHAFIARYSRPGDVVLDPFSGRGTAPLQALAEGRIGVGNDLNPLAQVLTAAKVEPGLPAETRTRVAALRLAWNADAAAWLALGERVVARPAHPSSFVPGRLGWRTRRAPRGRPDRGRPRIPPADARPAALRAEPASTSTTGSTGSSRARSRACSRARPRLPVDDHAQHVLDGAPLRPRLRGSQRRTCRPRRTCSTPDGEARPPVSPALRARRHRARRRWPAPLVGAGPPTGPASP